LLSPTAALLAGHGLSVVLVLLDVARFGRSGHAEGTGRSHLQRFHARKAVKAAVNATS
jgi:hypothetical protein